MLIAAKTGAPKQILESEDINALAGLQPTRESMLASCERSQHATGPIGSL